FLQGQGERPGLLLDRHHEAAVARDDAELRVLALALRARDQEGLVGGGYAPEEHGSLQVGSLKGDGSRRRNEPTCNRRPRPGRASVRAHPTRPRTPRSRREPGAAPRQALRPVWRRSPALLTQEDLVQHQPRPPASFLVPSRSVTREG